MTLEQYKDLSLIIEDWELYSLNIVIYAEGKVHCFFNSALYVELDYSCSLSLFYLFWIVLQCNDDKLFTCDNIFFLCIQSKFYQTKLSWPPYL